MGTSVATEKQSAYRSAIVNVLNEYHRLNSRDEDEAESIAIYDDLTQNYLLMLAGWQGQKRIKTVQIHIRLRDERIWIEEDWTEDGVVCELMRLGIERSAIELAFLPPNAREFADV